MLILDGYGSHIDLEFLWIYKQNKVRLLFLPTHSSHVLQPLDLSIFSVVKRFYHQQIQELSHLDNAALVRKERFITTYHIAREGAITKRVIHTRWATAGICPLNIKRVVNSSQVTQRAATPPRQDQAHLAESYLSTPCGPPALEAENKRLQSQLEALKPLQPRKKVRIDLNQRFASIDQIMIAKQASALLEQQNSSPDKEKEAEKLAAEVAAKTLQSMCSEWQL
ncbi:Tigger transposable element-derived protein 2 [Paraphaeosphaeria sporulosa]